MDFDGSWNALLKPGAAQVYFDALRSNKFQVDATGYSSLNAWWLAELCRLIYKQQADEKNPADPGPARESVLSEVGLHEHRFFNRGDTQCSIVLASDSADVRFAALIFRGTTDLQDWLTDFEAVPERWRGTGRVHIGFRDALELVWDDVMAALEGIDCPLFCAGHSLGAALATLAAALVRPRALYTFGSPRVGDTDFSAMLASIPNFRIVNNLDVVTTVPPPLDFHHVGELHYITHEGKMLTDPDELTIARDKLKRDHLSLFSGDLFSRVDAPPELLADHAPVNYVAHLERLF